MASTPPTLLLLLLLLLLTFILLFFTTSTSTSTLTSNITSIQTLCQSTPYPTSCLNSLKLTISITLNPSFLTSLLQTLTTAISESTSLLPLLSPPPNSILEHQRGTLFDCQDLHSITLSSLKLSQKLLSSPANDDRLYDVRTHLSAALTNKNTCSEGLSSASGPGKDRLVSSWMSAYRHVSNSLSIASMSSGGRGRRLSRRDRRLLQTADYGEYDPSAVS